MKNVIENYHLSLCSIDKLNEFIKEYANGKKEIVAVYLFGSALNSSMELCNDIDLAFLLKTDEIINTFKKSIELNVEIYQLTACDKFDVIVLNDAPLPFRNDIINEGKVLYCKDDVQRIIFETTSKNEYNAFKVYIDYYDKFMKERLCKEDKKMAIFNKEIVFQRANMAEISLKKLDELKGLPDVSFLTNPHNIALAEHYLRISIDALVDLATHIIAVKGFGRPCSSGDIVKLLSQNEVIAQDDVIKELRLIKLRDRLIHLYWEIDGTEIYEFLQKDLAQINDFLNALLIYIEKTSVE